MKKKAIKIAAASAVAASAFVAAAPLQSEAASNVGTTVDQAVVQMQKAYHTYGDVTAKGQFADINAVYKQYNVAKTAYANAKAVVAKAGGAQKDAYLAKLDSNYKELISKRVVTYIDAYKYGTSLEGYKTDLEAALTAKDWTKAEAGYHKISSELKTRTVILDRVYGKTTRDLLKSEFKVSAQELHDSIKNEVTVYMAYGAAAKALALTPPDLATAKTQIDKAEAVSFDKNTEIGKALVAYGTQVKAAYETLVAPVVSSVSAINATTVTVNLATAKAGLVATNFKVLVDGTQVTPSAVVADATGANYTLTVASLDGKAGKVSVNGKEAAYDFSAPKVDSVSAINAKQLVVTFNKPVKNTSVIANPGTDDTLVDGVFTFTRTPAAVDDTATVGIDESLIKNVVADTATGKLSADGKTLTITAAGAQYFDGSYAVNVKDQAIQTIAGDKLAKYATTVTVADLTRPTFTKVEYLNSQTARVYFSEPLSSKGTFTYKLADGTVATGVNEGTVTDNYVDIDLSAAALNAVNKDITVTVIGATDYKGNVVSPNPVTFTVKKDTADTVAPTVVSLTATSKTTFDVKFSEELSKVTADTTLASITAGTDAATKFTQDTTDPTLYHVTVAPQTGLQTVAFAANAVKDKAGNGIALYSKLVNFDVDTAAPTVVSTSIQKINGVENLIVNFNEDITTTGLVDGVSLAGTYVKDYVTNPVTLITDAAGTTLNAAATAPNYNAGLDLYQAVSGKSKSIALSLAGLPVGDYTIKLPKGIVKDASGNDNAEKTSVTFTRASDLSSGKPVLTGAKVAASTLSNSKVLVTFDKKVDPTTALNAANYSVEGAVVESVALTSNSVSGATVELKLAQNSNTFTGLHVVTVSGVKSDAGIQMDSATVNTTLNENVAPTVTKAELTSTSTITVTFSENVYNSTLTDDFDVYVGGTKLSGVVTATTGATPSKTLVITLPAVTTAQVASGIVVKPTSAININDATLAGSGETTGNTLSFTSINVQ